MSCLQQISLAGVTFDPEAALKEFRQGAQGSGAIVSFTGVVRPQAGDDAVSTLFLQHYPVFTEQEIARIVALTIERWSVNAVCVIHRVGVLEPFEPIVFVATASTHRRAAFEAADYLMDYLKTKAPFWKKEYRASGAVWIEPRKEDERDVERWNDPDNEDLKRDAL